MKAILKYMFAGVMATSVLASCNDNALETEPTTALSSGSLFSTASSALVPLNGIYRGMYMYDLGPTGNYHQAFGISAYNTMAEVMGEDFVMKASGSGWFWYDCVYNVKSRFATSTWRSYDFWHAHYAYIANANYIIAAESTMGGNKDDVNYVVGQAYAIRAYGYFMLSQVFARTYKGHESEPCLPIYTEPTDASTEGKPRATVAEVYKQIDSDINKALELLEGQHGSEMNHIGYDVALGLKARICLVENDWDGAAKAAEKAIEVTKATIIPVADFVGLNNIEKKNVMWGSLIIADQTTGYASYFSHMDTNVSYAQRAPKQISRVLYDKMSDTDTRKTLWWDENSSYTEPTSGIQQTKFAFKQVSTWEGDYIWMRVEEMYLAAAEAECRMGNEDAAKKYLTDLMAMRDPEYDCSALTGTEMGKLTTDWTGSLLEEITIQRRIELWGEAGRVYDIRRYKQGFRRTTEMGWPTSALLTGRPTENPENYMWVLTIPQAEFDGNVNMTLEKDQNPAGDE